MLGSCVFMAWAIVLDYHAVMVLNATIGLTNAYFLTRPRTS